MAKKFAYDRLFGSDIKDEIQEKIKHRQNLNVSIDFGESNPDSNKSTFEGMADMSSRIPWGRMWAVVQNYSLSPDLATCQKNSLKDSENYKAEVNINDIKVYQIGTADFTNLDNQTSAGGGMKDFQSTNEFFRPGIGITSIRSESSGNWGLIKSTVIQFKVFNFFDFDNIVLPFFLTPGSTIFCDFGWDTAYIYDPNKYLKGSDDNSTSFEYKSLYEEIFGTDSKDGMVTKANGDLEVIIGLVSKYDVKLDAEGNFDCTITLTSQNYALLDYDQSSGMPIDLEIENRVWDKVAARLKEEGINFEAVKDELNSTRKYGEITKKLMATYVGPTQYHDNLFMMEGSGGGAESKGNMGKLFHVIPDKAYETGVYFRSLDHKIPAKEEIESVNTSNAIYITFRFFAEILNALLANRKELFEDGDIEFIFEDIPVTFNKYLYIRQFYSTHYDKQQISFIYPTRKKDTYQGTGVIDKEGNFAGSGGDNYNTIDEIDTLRAVDMGDLFINLDKVLAIFRAEKSVELALKKVLKMVDDDSFGVIKLGLLPDNTIGKNIKVIDTNFYPDIVDKDGDKLSDIFEFTVFSPNTIADSLDLSMNMGTSKIANRLAIIGSTADKMLFPASDDMKMAIADADIMRDLGDNQYFAHLPTTTDESQSDFMMHHVATFKESLIKKQLTPEELKQRYDAVEKANKRAAFKNAFYTDQKKKEGEAEKPTKSKYFQAKEKWDLTDAKTAKYFPKNIFIDNIHTYFKYRIMDTEVETKSFANVLLPYTCTISVYGISGIVPGNRFRIDYLPERYRSRTYFVAKQVSHDVSSGGWKTTISAEMRLWGVEMFKNIVKYKPIVHLSKRKLYAMGYGEEQRDAIQDNNSGFKNPKDFWTIMPSWLLHRCRDEKATNFDDESRYDCIGGFEGNDTSCCTYPEEAPE